MNKRAGVALLLAFAPAVFAPAVFAQAEGRSAARAGAGAPGVASTSHQMVVTRAGSQPSAKGPVQYFTGTVRVDPLFGPRAPPTAAGVAVTFEPAARSAWHTHPAGQVLIVTAGVGRVQQLGAAVQEIRPGDVIWTPPGVKHWHGAAPTTAMTHIAIQEAVGGKNVERMEKVSDEQYGK